MRISQIHFGANNTRIQHALACQDISTVLQLELANDEDLLRIPNMARVCVADIRALVPRNKWQVWTPEKQEAEFQREYAG